MQRHEVRQNWEIFRDAAIAIFALMSFTLFIMTLVNFVFGQSRLWKLLHGLVAVPVETVRFERSIHLFDCNTSWVNLYIVSLYKPVSLSKIKVCVVWMSTSFVTHNVTRISKKSGRWMWKSVQAKHTVHATAENCGTALQVFMGKVCWWRNLRESTHFAHK